MASVSAPDPSPAARLVPPSEIRLPPFVPLAVILFVVFLPDIQLRLRHFVIDPSTDFCWFFLLFHSPFAGPCQVALTEKNRPLNQETVQDSTKAGE